MDRTEIYDYDYKQCHLDAQIDNDNDFIARYIFWSIFQALAPMIWFYPLNELEISGYEVFAVAWLSPIFLLIPGLWNIIQNEKVLISLRLLTVGTLASFQASTTLLRLVILSLGASVSMLVLAATLWSQNRWIRYRTFRGLVIGLHVVLASRIWFTTINPVWVNNSTNSIVIAVGVISVGAEFIDANEPQPTISKPEKWAHHWIPCGLGLGSLFFLTHLLCGEVSVVTRWTVRGLPDTGPLPLPSGAFVLLTIAAGSVVGLKTSRFWDLFDVSVLSCSTFVLLLVQNPYIAFIGGLCAIYIIMSLWPTVIDKVTQSHPIGCLTFAATVYVLQVLFWVWTIVFNFVPYGEYTREHTDWVLACLSLCMLIFILSCRSSEKPTTIPDDIRKHDLKKYYCYAIILLTVIGLTGMLLRCQKYKPGITAQSLDIGEDLAWVLVLMVINGLMILLVLPTQYTLVIKSSVITFLNQENSKVFSAGVWTYHFGYDNKGWPSLERTAQLINDSEVDVMTLLESDASKLFLGNNDLATWMAETLQMYVDFGPSTKDHTYGNLILSKYPIVKSTHHLLPSPEGELAPAITASIDIQGTVVDFVVTHMGNDKDYVDRALQTEFLAKELHNTSNPAVFLGYMTTVPGSQNYWYLRKAGGVRDIDPEDDFRFCQYIFYKKLIRLGFARLSHGGLSDTEVQLAKFAIPEDPHSTFKDNKKSTINSKHQKVDPGHIFSRKFGRFFQGDGDFQDHRYHMGTPKYFFS